MDGPPDDTAPTPPGAPVGPGDGSSQATGMASVVRVGPEEDIAAVCGRIDSAPTFAVVLHAPRGNRALSREIGIRRLVRHVEDAGRTVAIATRVPSLASRARQAGIPVSGRPDTVRWDSGGHHVVGVGRRNVVLPSIGGYIQAGVIVVAILLIIGSLLFAAPSADVTVYPVTERIETTVTLTASLDQQTVDVEQLLVPAVPVSVTRTVTVAVPTTGTIGVPIAAAHATVEITNPTGANVGVPRGAILFSGPNFLGFTVDNDILAPPGETVSVTVTATDPGPDSNVAVDTITGWQREDLRVLTLANPEPATGGASEPRQAVSADDVVRLRQLARSLAQSDEMRAEIAAERPRDAVFFQSSAVNVEEGDPSVAVGAEADIVYMDVTLTLNATAIGENDLDELAAAILMPSEESVFIPGTVSALETGARQSEPAQGTVRAEFVLSGEFAQGITTSDVAGLVKGKSAASAESTLVGQNDIQDAEVDLAPGWAPWLPRFDFRIDVEFRSPSELITEESASQPDDATPDPTATPGSTARVGP